MQAPLCDAWVAKDGAYFGGRTRAPTATLFHYHLMGAQRSQHPDAMFSPAKRLVLAPGQEFKAAGDVWMLAECGLAGWKAQ